MAVEDVGADVGDGPADGHHPPRVAGQAGPVRDVHGGLRGAVQVLERRVGQARIELLAELVAQGLAAGHHPPQRPALGDGRLLEEDGQHGGHEVQGADAVAADAIGEVGRVAVPAGAGHDQRGPFGQGPEELPHRRRRS